MVNQTLKFSVLFLIFLFPVVAVSVQHGGSIIYGLLVLTGLIFGVPNWKRLAQIEKNLLFSFAVFAIALLLSLVNVDDWSSTLGRLERVLRFLAIIPVYLLVRPIGHESLKSILLGAAAGCVVLGMQAWYFTAIEHSREVHGAYNKILFGDIAMLLVVIVAVGLKTVAKKRWHFVLGCVCIGLGLYASLLSETRGAWLLLPVLLPIMLYLYRDQINARRIVVTFSSLVLLVLLGEFWVPASAVVRVNAGIEDIRLYQHNPMQMSSLGSRINMWRDSITLFKQHPILGVGLGDFRWERNKLMDNGLAFKDTGYDHAHNIYFDSMATTGILGLLALMASIFILPGKLLYTAWPSSEHREWDSFAMLAGICTLVAFAVFGLSEGWLARNPFINTYAVFVAVFVSSAGRFLAAESGVSHP